MGTGASAAGKKKDGKIVPLHDKACSPSDETMEVLSHLQAKLDTIDRKLEDSSKPKVPQYTSPLANNIAHDRPPSGPSPNVGAGKSLVVNVKGASQPVFDNPGFGVQPSTNPMSPKVVTHWRSDKKACDEASKTALFLGGEVDFGHFNMAGSVFPYSSFMARLYNCVLSLGMRKESIMPSRAFCSDESQGAALLLMTKHFGIFPFNHGLVGGIVANEWHGPHASHGDDLVIVAASHVGYVPETGEWGTYRRVRCCDGNHTFSPTCGAMHATVGKYDKEYRYAQKNIEVRHAENYTNVVIDNDLLHIRGAGILWLQMDRLLERGDIDHHSIALCNGWAVQKTYSTRVEFRACQSLHETLRAAGWKPDTKGPIGKDLTEDLFYFQGPESPGQLEANLLPHMPAIVCSPVPMLLAAIFSSQHEFDRSFRTMIKADCYKGRDLFFISGVNIDISPAEKETRVPILHFIPWAAMHLRKDGTHVIYEQKKLIDLLMSSSATNENEIDLEAAACNDRVNMSFIVQQDAGDIAVGTNSDELCKPC